MNNTYRRYLANSIVTLLLFFSRVLSEDASCYVFGTQHVFTFDKQRIDFNTDLELTLARTCPPAVQVQAAFDISILNEHKYFNVDSASQVKCVKLVYKADIAMICTDQTASVNGDDIADAMLTSNSNLMVYYGTRGREIAIQVANTLIRVSVTRVGLVTLTIPSSYKTKVCGLCGNYNDQPTDDLRTATGEDVSTENIYTRGSRIAQSYLVPPDSGQVLPFIPSVCANVPEEEMVINSGDMCGLYEGSGYQGVSKCVTERPELAATFFDLCKYDYCENYLMASDSEMTSSGCEDNSAICVRNEAMAKEAINSIAEVFVMLCNTFNYTVDDGWRTEYRTLITCSSGTYSQNGPYCPNVCGLAADRCDATGIDGCVCGFDEWKEGDACVPSSYCGCSDGNTGEYYKVTEWWVDNLCTRNFTCVLTNQISIETLECSENSECTPSGCVCTENYIGDGITCSRTCEPGKQAIADNCEDCPVGTYKSDWGTESCILCPSGQVTDETGSLSASDCKDIKMVGDSPNSLVYTQVADQTFLVRVPADVLPNGLPYGGQHFREVWVSTNGVVSFGKSYVGRVPKNLETVNEPLLAPFWFRQDLRVNGGISPVYNSKSELKVSLYNQIDSNLAAQKEAETALNQIQILLGSYEKYRELALAFHPKFAMVISWKNTVPNPAVFYQYREAVYYQCVIVTNGMRTYAIFIYPTGGITLMSLYQLRSIYMGFNAQDGGVHQFNYYKSATVGINTIDIDPSNTGNFTIVCSITKLES
ncbi:zonadhesin-like [Watersipora subatra]|uniref:zonadhesin-like n=1 Tax=Watersipora subatra TaxID=2589382 RepID=UPI00355B18FB